MLGAQRVVGVTADEEGAGIRGEAAMEGRFAGPSSGSSESVTLSTSVVTVTASRGSSAIGSISGLLTLGRVPGLDPGLDLAHDP